MEVLKLPCFVIVELRSYRERITKISLCLLVKGKRQIKDVCMKRKTWDTISFVIPFPRSSFLLPAIQIFGYSL